MMARREEATITKPAVAAEIAVAVAAEAAAEEEVVEVVDQSLSMHQSFFFIEDDHNAFYVPSDSS